MTKDETLQEAKRCFNCPKPRCAEGCPVHTHIPQFIHELKEGNFDTAAAILNRNNFMSAITCRVCDQQHQCEGNCIQGIRGKSIAIGQLERFANDKGSFTPAKKLANGKKIAVIGSGPSGLTLANALSLEGFAVTVFEKEKLLGGMVRYGIPDFRLDKRILDNLIEKLSGQGVQFVVNKEIQGNAEVQELLHDFDYVYIATGSGVSKFMGIPGEELSEDVFGATEFLAILNGPDNPLKEQLQKDFQNKKEKCNVFYAKMRYMNYDKYANEYLVSDNLSKKELEKNSNLYSISDYLKSNNNYKIYHTVNDYLNTPEQLKKIKQYAGNKAVFFNNGSHMGFTYREEFMEELKKDLVAQ